MHDIEFLVSIYMLHDTFLNLFRVLIQKDTLSDHVLRVTYNKVTLHATCRSDVQIYNELQYSSKLG